MKKLTLLLFLTTLTPVCFSQQVSDVTLYENTGYGGGVELVPPNAPGGAGRSVIQLNELSSSVKVPAGMVAIVYEHTNESSGYGHYVELMEDCPDLSVYDLNNKVSFVSVFPVTRDGFNFVRAQNKNGTIIPGHWEKARANGKLPTSQPAIVQNLIAPLTNPLPPERPKVDETLPVFRIQLRIITGNNENDDTDKEVYVKLNNGDTDYFIDYGPDDFERNADKKYDIISDKIKKISDIDFIEISAKGDDVWGIKKVELYINNSGQPIFSEMFTQPSRVNGTGNWARKISFSHQKLRLNSSWKNIATDEKIKNPSPLIEAATIRSMIESMVGNMIHHEANGKLSWGDTDGINTVWGDHVEIKANGNVLNIDLDLEANVTGTNPEIDVKFDLVFECQPDGRILIKTENVKISCNLDYKIVELSCSTVRTVINSLLKKFGLDRFTISNFNTNGNTFNQTFTIGGGDYKCKGAIVTAKGDVVLY
ncbi:MAG: PLAT/LH2 domain-containing protein [Chitinophagaceae bacterium]